MSEVINKISRFLVRLKRCFVKFNESSLVWGPQSEVSRRRVYEFPKETARIQEGKSCKDHNFVLDTDTGAVKWVNSILYAVFVDFEKAFWNSYGRSPRPSPETGSHIQSVWCDTFECSEIHINELTGSFAVNFTLN